jgi:hypothetical protein
MSDDVECARCGVIVPTKWAFVEEGDEWECPFCWHRCEENELRNEIVRLTRERYEGVKDAERYRWLRENVGYVTTSNYSVTGLAMDIAIDAARGKK